VGQAIAPVAVAGAVMGVLANLVQVGFQITPQAIEPRWERLNPVTGLGRLVSFHGATETIKSVCKIAVLAVVAYRTLAPAWTELPALAEMELLAVISWEIALGVTLAVRVIGAYCVLGVADYAFQRWQHERSLRMTRGEIRDEGKQQEGNPQIRARVRGLQQERSMRRMMQDVAKANVVIVNPTHIAVAIQYDGRMMRAPKVLAKGKRLLAERIIAIAREHRIPVIQDIPLARSLYKLVDVGGEIPVALYTAMAKILAYVFAQTPRRGAA
jgi:flagellar biosynthetic protein FlhB